MNGCDRCGARGFVGLCGTCIDDLARLSNNAIEEASRG